MPGVGMFGITKRYDTGGVLANDRVDLSVRDREIHALVGENGAGKSTLMRILYGLERPDSGRVEIGGRAVSIASPADARRLGVGMVHQHFTTVPDFTVAENVALGAEPRRLGVLYDARAAARAAAEVIERNGFHLDPDRPAGDLTVGERQQLEIVKLLYRKAEILILDEPTAVLAEQEVRSLFATLRALRESGKTVIMITHKVREVKEIADSVTVMRAGRTVDRLDAGAVDESELACLMMGTDSCRSFSRSASAGRGGSVFEMDRVVVKTRSGGRHALDGISLAVASGEVLGVCGVAGNGLAELEDVASGLARPTSGRCRLEGKPLPRHRRPGLAYVPADRMERGACVDETLAENLAALDRDSFFPKGMVDAAKAKAAAMAAIAKFTIRGAPDSPLSSLSGGNVQKVILAREISANSPFILFSDPTWGLDVASAEFMYERIVDARDEGAAILLLSSNLDELLALSDRIAVLYRGRLVCLAQNAPDLTRERLGEYMLGLKDDFADGQGAS